jgi:RimJ/RimL family protein N-acetyltransferase
MIRFQESERLYLRQARLSDLPLFIRMDSDPEVMRFIGDGNAVTDPKRTETALVARVLADYERFPGLGLWVACTRQDDLPIGWFSLKPCNVAFVGAGGSLQEPTRHVELGYRLERQAWGQGYATEMARVLVAHGFEHLGLEEIVAVTIHENRASIRVMEKLGLSYWSRGHYYGVNVDVYGLWRLHWERRQAAPKRAGQSGPT